MYTINISKIPNQSFFVVVGENQIDFRLHTFKDLMYCDIYVNGTMVSASTRCTPSNPLLPRYFNSRIGNFMFITDDDEYPNHENFGDTCNLIFITPEEIKEFG